MQTFFIRTYGCQMNELDSLIIKGILERRNMVEAAGEEEAHLLIFNTCSIRDLAERKVLGKLGLLFRSKKKRIIGIAGCMAIAKKERLFQKFPQLDFVIGPNNIADLDTILDELACQKGHHLKTDLQHTENIDYLLAKRHGIKADVSIIRGCNNFCSYCIVPYTRGREASRPDAGILAECKILIEKGVKEICLLGQNVNSYGKDLPGSIRFPQLLARINDLEGLLRIRFLTSHPKDISPDLILAIKELPKVCEFVHFPIQSGSNAVLKSMNRKYTREEYLEKALKLKTEVPNVRLGTDIIVGFPGETEADFLQTVSVFEKMRFGTAFIFAYSPRSGTAAAQLADNVLPEEKQKRLQHLLALHQRIMTEEAINELGKVKEVLVERFNRDQKTLKGHTRSGQKVIFKGAAKEIGSLQQVKLLQFKNQTFLAALIET